MLEGGDMCICRAGETKIVTSLPTQKIREYMQVFASAFQPRFRTIFIGICFQPAFVDSLQVGRCTHGKCTHGDAFKCGYDLTHDRTVLTHPHYVCATHTCARSHGAPSRPVCHFPAPRARTHASVPVGLPHLPTYPRLLPWGGGGPRPAPRPAAPRGRRPRSASPPHPALPRRGAERSGA